MYKTNNYKMDLLITSQAQKEVTVNEALGLIDNLLNKAIYNIIDELPCESQNGDLYLISASPVKELVKNSNYLAFYMNGWRFIYPRYGMIFFNIGSGNWMVFKDKWLEV
jgi:hypothetical protein